MQIEEYENQYTSKCIINDCCQLSSSNKNMNINEDKMNGVLWVARGCSYLKEKLATHQQKGKCFGNTIRIMTLASLWSGFSALYLPIWILYKEVPVFENNIIQAVITFGFLSGSLM